MPEVKVSYLHLLRSVRIVCVRQNADRGIGSIDYQEVLADIIRRDELDSSRDTAPLRPAKDAVLLDSSSMHVEEVIGSICGLARARMAL